jgi:drug/metabolite transporter (DMT)-like permease
MTIRFVGAAILLPIVLPGARQHLGDKAVWRAGAALSFFVLSGFLLQMFGMHGIDSATSAFLTSLYVVFTALALAVWARKLPPVSMIIGIAAATIGAGFISGPPQVTFDHSEWLTVLCAIAFAGHILSTDYYTKRLPPLPVTTATFVITGLVCAGLAGFGISANPQVSSSAIFALVSDPNFLWPAMLCTVLGSVVCLSILNVYQRHLSPVRAAILFALEPVWAALIALAVGQVHPDRWFIFGAAALLGGNLIVEVAPRLMKAKAQN